MKNLKLILPVALLAFSSCSQNTRHTENDSTKTDTAIVESPEIQETKGLYATLYVKDTIKIGDPVELKFTVYNNADTAMKFCKWHTPFEPLLSKYLDVKDENGLEADYKGAMAKRIMPPPASSYTTVNAKDSISINMDVLKGYNINKPGKYTLIYNSQAVSGLAVKDSVSFVYIK